MIQAVAQAPTLETRTPEVLNSGGRVAVALPVLNSGNATAATLTLTSVMLGAAPRVEPALPLVLGDLAPDDSTSVNAVFGAQGLTPGSKLLLTVRGTYRLAGVAYGFTLNRSVAIPAPVTPPVAFLSARVQAAVDAAAGTWSYTVLNTEPAGSPRWISVVSIDTVGPFTVTGTPAGWQVDTDNLTYVLWFAADTAPPYPNQIAPGDSRGGFQIRPDPGRSTSEARAYTISSWNHQTNQADLVVSGTTLTPARS
ncbi:MAG TPA: hypothetical protein VFR81_06350 [Longimicrobium sp.]|nr:hypothetical protein [Longimicrobium sp.]